MIIIDNRQLKRLLLILLSIAAFSSCWHPPFNPDISASVITSQKLGTPVWEVRTRLPYNARGGYYVPARTLYNQGTWIAYDAGRIRMSNFMYDTATLKGNLYNFIELPATYGSYFYIIPARSDVNKIYATYSGLNRWIRYDVYSMDFSMSNQDPYVIGCGFMFGNSQDTLYMLKKDASIYPITVLSLSVDGYTDSWPPTFSINQTYSILPPELPTTVTLAVPTSSGALYLSGTKTDGSAVTWFWPGVSDTPYILPIDKPLTGILSDGRLIADTEDRLYVYSPDGSSSFVISTGALHFSYERYDSVQSRWISVFTRTIEIPVPKSTDSEYLISIYEIPTSQLSELAR